MIYHDVTLFNSQLTPERRLLGLDIGQKRIGVALSDIFRNIATPYMTLQRGVHLNQTIKALRQIIKEHEITGLVIGYPLEMDGKCGLSCQMILGFLEAFEKIETIAIYLQDERFSTAAVSRMLDQTNMTRKKQQSLDDKLSAGYILQCFLDKLRYEISRA